MIIDVRADRNIGNKMESCQRTMPPPCLTHNLWWAHILPGGLGVTTRTHNEAQTHTHRHTRTPTHTHTHSLTHRRHNGHLITSRICCTFSPSKSAKNSFWMQYIPQCINRSNNWLVQWSLSPPWFTKFEGSIVLTWYILASATLIYIYPGGSNYFYSVIFSLWAEPNWGTSLAGMYIKWTGCWKRRYFNSKNLHIT